jgi:hypothetical protein
MAVIDHPFVPRGLQRTIKLWQRRIIAVTLKRQPK